MRLNTLFPLQTYQHIYQLEGYSPKRFLKWWFRHPLTRNISSKKPLVLTSKVKTSLFLSKAILLLLFITSLRFIFFFPLFILLFLFPFPLLFLVTIIRYIPDQIVDRRLKIAKTRRAILSHLDLTVVGITGSFGKTSTKDFLFEILKRYKPTLKTPESYNTVHGIAKTIDFELLNRHQFFICEMAAYIRGEIKELTYQAPPKFAILTAIGTQHLERFRSLKNTTLAKFELIDAVMTQNALVNLDNNLISKHIEQSKYKGIQTYSLENPNADFYVNKYQFSKNGVTFSLRYKDKSYSFESSLFGTSNLQNLTAAISMALLLKVPYTLIKKATKSIAPSPHRLELKKIGKATLVDDAYSSNEQGFANLIQDLKKVKGKKVLITPGIIELGHETIPVHLRLGQAAASVFDTIILVGNSERTQTFERGLKLAKTSVHVDHLFDFKNLWPTINQLATRNDWIIIENDLADNY